MKAIVTGGAGFLGSHLCEALLQKDYEVICVDNFLTGSEKNIALLGSNPKFQLLKRDVNEKLPENLKADCVFHFASPASPNLHSKKSYHALPFETMEVNTRGTWHLANFCIRNNAKLLFASTSEVYGDPTEHPQKESYRGNVSTIGPRSVYDEAKRYGETIIAAFVRSKNLDGRIVRIFNTYGPRMALDDGRATIEFVVKAVKNEPLPIFGDGSQTRSFCYVTDLIAGVILMMESNQTKGEVVNLGNPDEFTIQELAEKVKKIAGSDSTIEKVEALPQDDPLQRCPDISKAKELLDWQPKIGLDEGLERLIEYVRQEL